MIGPRWRKVLYDLWGNKLRSLLVVAAITIGVFAVGMIATNYVIVSEDMNKSYAATDPASAQIYLDPFDDDFLEHIRRLPGVKDATGQQSVNLRMRVGADGWKNITLYTNSDYENQTIGKITLDQGAWPEAQEVAIERSTLGYSGAQIGDIVEFQLADGTIKKMPVTGVVHDQNVFSTGTGVYGYIHSDTLEWLRLSNEYTQLNLVVSENALDADHIKEVTDQVGKEIEESGRTVYFTYLPIPGEHPAAQTVQGVLGVLVVLGFLSVLLGSFLVTNTLSALLTQHIRQIGVMKAVGARTRQLVGMYVVLILFYGLIGLLIAAPLGSYAGYGLSFVLANAMNFDLEPFRPVSLAITLQTIIALVVPLAAGIIPVLSGTRITIREAISGYGLGAGGFGKSLLDRFIESVRFISRPLMIALRNTFRRKSRLLLTLITLSLAGAIFISIFNVRSSLIEAIDRIGKYFLSDVNISFDRSYYVDEINQLAQTVPGVKRVEGWAGANGNLLEADNTASAQITLLAPPVDSELIDPDVQTGRWVIKGDQNAIVLSTGFLIKHPELKVGDEIRLEINNRKSTWQIVGFFAFPGGDQQLMAYTTYEYLSDLLNEPRKSGFFRIVTEEHTPAYQLKVRDQLETVFRGQGYTLTEAETGSALIAGFSNIINLLVAFFLVMSVLIAMVGSVGLTATMSMNVLERTREIGVMRAIGASTIAILKLVIVEGMIIGFISWLVGTLLAVPLSQVMSEAVSQALFQAPAQFTFSLLGFLIWMAIMAILATAASILPAFNAARLTVRDVLAYE